MSTVLQYYNNWMSITTLQFRIQWTSIGHFNAQLFHNGPYVLMIDHLSYLSNSSLNLEDWLAPIKSALYAVDITFEQRFKRSNTVQERIVYYSGQRKFLKTSLKCRFVYIILLLVLFLLCLWLFWFWNTAMFPALEFL